MINKRSNDDLKASRPTLEEIKFIPKVPIYFLLENIRSAHNVGSIFRTADGIGAKKIFLAGYTCKPDQKVLIKTALGSEKSVDWEHDEDTIRLANSIIDKKINLVLLEHTKSSKNLHNLKWDFPLCIVLGNEVDGVSEELIRLCNNHVEIPMNGIKQSLNVSVAAGIIGYEILRCYNRYNNLRGKDT